MKAVSLEPLSFCWMVVFLLLLTSGCSELVIKDEDDGSVVIGKVMYRTVFAIGTLGYSEIKMQEVTQEYERAQKLKAYETRVMEYLNKGEITEAQAQQMILKEKERIWSAEDPEK